MLFLSLQPLTPIWLPVALELDQCCFGGLWTADGYRREIESPNSELLILTCASSPPPHVCPSAPLLGIGCYWAILEEAHITLLGVIPEYQRQGLGQALFYALLKSACLRGLERATLEVRISNQSALALYQKFGFREAGRRKCYYQDTGEDALVLWRGGLQSPDFGALLQFWWEDTRDRLYRSGWQLAPDWDHQMVKEPGLTW
ncbi:ribosomal protein S18-alanine N-acetyltransferase [Leptothermofonsia sichuanensis E412]|uniref:ribosomal protein S18-alanine N-acetyltransferase n=1 Tax=Leptothermofonsia sichuanensis TaxID=2917832 RepID=UPI001CA79727|nr:ribosomal protein S18-alanine N-acetyltransferase [Leptothermofonsia sichuanensis]QZZ20256.1 ribosomal protein S18-alanine N-acetyltransferase [Leptothermofonsia sichuanensis E412]